MSRHIAGMTERRFYQLNNRRNAPAVQLWGVAVDEQPGSRGGFFLSGQGYSISDISAVVDWMYERAAGYKTLRRFEGGANWPT